LFSKKIVLKKILPVFSYIFHPIFIPTIAALLYMWYSGNTFLFQEKLFVLFQVVLLTLCIPILGFFILKVSGQIDSVMVYKISQRKIPLLLHCFLIILLVKNTIVINRYPELHFFLIGGLFSSLMALLLLFMNIKASLHLLSISSLTVFIIGLSMHLQLQNTITVALLILLNGLIASSRLVMNAHTYKELVIGFALGAVPQLFLLFLWL
jgi:hypothetical protein